MDGICNRGKAVKDNGNRPDLQHLCRHVIVLGKEDVFQWGIYGVVVSKIVFSATASMLNSHALRQKVGYIQEQKKTFLIPLLASAIMGIGFASTNSPTALGMAHCPRPSKLDSI